MKKELVQFSKKHSKYYEFYNYRIINDSKLFISIGVYDDYCFILIDFNNKSHLFKYDIKEFSFEEESYYINIGNNFFSKNSVTLDLNSDVSIKAKINFYDHYKVKSKDLKQQYILSFSSKVRGSILYNNNFYSLDNYTMLLDKYYSNKLNNYSCLMGHNNNYISISKVNEDVVVNIITKENIYRIKGKFEIVNNKLIYENKKYFLEIDLYNKINIKNLVNYVSCKCVVRLVYKNEVIINEGILLNGVVVESSI